MIVWQHQHHHQQHQHQHQQHQLLSLLPVAVIMSLPLCPHVSINMGKNTDLQKETNVLIQRCIDCILFDKWFVLFLQYSWSSLFLFWFIPQVQVEAINWIMYILYILYHCLWIIIWWLFCWRAFKVIWNFYFLHL